MPAPSRWAARADEPGEHRGCASPRTSRRGSGGVVRSHYASDDFPTAAVTRGIGGPTTADRHHTAAGCREPRALDERTHKARPPCRCTQGVRSGIRPRRTRRRAGHRRGGPTRRRPAIWLLIISGSGNAKTENVQALDGINATLTSTISSEAALLSRTAPKDRAKDATGGPRSRP